MPDVHPVLFEYEGIPVYMRLSLGCESPEVTRFQGSKGAIELREFSVTYHAAGGGGHFAQLLHCFVPGAPAEIPTSSNGTRNTILLPGREPAPETVTYNGNDYDDLRPHLWKFFEAVRSRKPVVQDAVFGHHRCPRLPSGQRIVLPQMPGALGRALAVDQVADMTFAGCPTFATSLFLSLRWETPTFASRIRQESSSRENDRRSFCCRCFSSSRRHRSSPQAADGESVPRPLGSHFESARRTIPPGSKCSSRAAN